MFTTLLQKEVREHLLTFRFGAAMLSTFVLIIFSVWVLGGNYLDKTSSFNEISDQYQELQNSVRVPSLLVPTIGYAPSRLSIFAQAESRLFGNFVEISRNEVPEKADVRLTNNELLESVNTFDLQMVVTIVLSLFAVLLSYDAFSGEREQGTLKLLMSYSTSRAQVFTAKFLSMLLVISIPVAISMVCSLIVLQFFFGIAFVGSEWLALLMMFFSTLLYAAVFIALGMLCSATLRRPSTSIIAAILFWSVLVFFIPLAANKVSEVAVSLRNPDEITNSKIKSREETNQIISDYSDRELSDIGSIMVNGGSLNSTGYSSIYAWDANPGYFRFVSEIVRYTHPLWMQRARQIWNLVQEHHQQKSRQAEMASYFSMLSPAYHVRAAFTKLAGSGYERYEQFMEDARRYRQLWISNYESKGFFTDNVVKYVSRRDPEEALDEENYQQRMQRMQQMRDRVNFREMDPKDYWALAGELPDDLLPEFTPEPAASNFEGALINMMAISILLALLLMAGLLAANRYDVR